MENKTMITKIKNYAIAFVSAVLALFGIYVWTMKVKKQSDLNKTDKSIDDNNKKIQDAEIKIKEVVEQKTEIKTAVVIDEIKIKELKDEIEAVSITPIEDVPTAKENIIKKTRRKGRRPNKNNKTSTTKTTTKPVKK